MSGGWLASGDREGRARRARGRTVVHAAAGVGVVGAGIFALALGRDPHCAMAGWLAAFAFGVSVAVGSLLLVMIHHTAESAWSIAFRRIHEAAAVTLPLFALFFAPVALALRVLFPWASGRGLAGGAAVWYSPAFFVARAYGYVAAWSIVALVLRRASVRQDRDGRAAWTGRERRVSAGATPFLAVTLTLAAFDWFMSVVPGWVSTMHGFYVFAAGFAGALGLGCACAWAAARSGDLPPEVGPAHFHALGRVLLVSVIFWAYIAFGALVLAWSADLPRENAFYAERTAGAWAFVAAALGVGHFALPFLALLSRALKRSPAELAIVGAWVLAFHALDAYWLIVPSLADGPDPLDLGAFLAVGGFAFAFGASRFFAVSPVPVHDPELAIALRYTSP
jgi:hypothetical protein